MRKLRGAMMCSLRITMLLATSILTGCSSSSVTITVKDKESGKPLEGIRIEQYQPASRLEKIINPVGTTYHSFSLAKSVHTDTNGQAIFRESSLRDIFKIFSGNTRPLLVNAWGKELSLSPEGNQSAVTKCNYSVWLEDGALKYSALPVKE